ncbi:MAG: BlaI/MecI/CopY family transcriptional regulator [Sciscionella sp.]
MADTAPGRGRRRAAGQLESEILATLAAATHPLTTGEVQCSLAGTLAYNTVHTILVRLYEKGLAERRIHGRSHRYAPAKGLAELTADRMRRLLGSDRTSRRAVLQQFVNGLDITDERTLRELLSATRQVPDEGIGNPE